MDYAFETYMTDDFGYGHEEDFTDTDSYARYHDRLFTTINYANYKDYLNCNHLVISRKFTTVDFSYDPLTEETESLKEPNFTHSSSRKTKIEHPTPLNTIKEDKGIIHTNAPSPSTTPNTLTQQNHQEETKSSPEASNNPEDFPSSESDIFQ